MVAARLLRLLVLALAFCRRHEVQQNAHALELAQIRQKFKRRRARLVSGLLHRDTRSNWCARGARSARALPHQRPRACARRPCRTHAETITALLARARWERGDYLRLVVYTLALLGQVDDSPKLVLRMNRR